MFSLLTVIFVVLLSFLEFYYKYHQSLFSVCATTTTSRPSQDNTTDRQNHRRTPPDNMTPAHIQVALASKQQNWNAYWTLLKRNTSVSINKVNQRRARSRLELVTVTVHGQVKHLGQLSLTSAWSWKNENQLGPSIDVKNVFYLSRFFIFQVFFIFKKCWQSSERQAD